MKRSPHIAIISTIVMAVSLMMAPTLHQVKNHLLLISEFAIHEMPSHTMLRELNLSVQSVVVD